MAREDLLIVSCPHCRSDNVRGEKWSRNTMALLVFLIGLPLPIRSKKYHCFDCTQDFVVKELPEATNDQRKTRSMRMMIVLFVIALIIVLLM